MLCYVCMFVRTYVGIYVCMDGWMDVCMYVRTYVRMYVCMCKYVHIYTYPDGPDVRFVAAFPVSSILAMSPQDQSLFAECRGLQLRSPVAVGRQAGLWESSVGNGRK